jgi:short-subunit dehydrogenase
MATSRKASKKSAEKAGAKSSARRKPKSATAKAGGRPTALITGASSGIGRELAVVFAEEGHDLVLVSRNKKRLDRLAGELEAAWGIRATVIAKDLADPRAPRALFSATKRRGIDVDVLVNDAGVVAQGDFRDMATAKVMNLVQLNVVALTELTSLYLQPMVQRGHGRILNVASTSAFQPVPYLAVYAASKAFVLSFTESINDELKGTGVNATALCPGFTETPMLDDIRHSHKDAGLLPSIFISDAKQVARDGFEACRNEEVVRVPGLANQLLASAAGMQPRWMMRAIASFVGRRAV